MPFPVLSPLPPATSVQKSPALPHPLLGPPHWTVTAGLHPPTPPSPAPGSQLAVLSTELHSQTRSQSPKGLSPPLLEDAGPQSSRVKSQRTVPRSPSIPPKGPSVCWPVCELLPLATLHLAAATPSRGGQTIPGVLSSEGRAPGRVRRPGLQPRPAPNWLHDTPEKLLLPRALKCSHL